MDNIKKRGGKIFYIADTHFNHENVIRYDERPFKDINQMNEALIEKWNETVTDNDTVYILGDLCWKGVETWRKIVNRLNGKKFLIRGNHDLKQFPADIRRMFVDIRDYMEIDDNGRQVILSHYAMPFYKSDCRSHVYHLYGHVHNTEEDDLLNQIKKYILKNDSREYGKNLCQFYNLWCGYYDYKPVTLDEVIARWNERSS